LKKKRYKEEEILHKKTKKAGKLKTLAILLMVFKLDGACRREVSGIRLGEIRAEW